MTDSLARGVLEVVGDTTSFEASMAKAGQAAARFEKDATQAAGKASAAMSGIGKAATEGLKELDAGTKRAITSLQLLTAKAELSPAAYQIFKAEVKGLNTEALAPYAAALDRALAKQAQMGQGTQNLARQLNLVGVSAGQATAAMRGLPAQITDIVTSLQGGQAPLTVLIQQGGQLKDQFGGIGNAFRALGSVLTPARLLLGGVATAAGVAALAYRAGAAETDEYRKALALTNNAAGTTIGQLQLMAQAVSGLSGGSQGKAAEVLAQLAGSAKVASVDLTNLTASAIRLERAGGPAALETAKAFAALAESPTQAALALTKTTGFLTAAVYEQARALELQGRTSAAASVVQQAYAASVSGSAKQLENGLGTLEKAWRGVGDIAKAAWDAMVGSGRPETVEARLKSTTEAVERARSAMDVDRNSGRRTGTRQAALQSALDAQGVDQSDVRTSRMAANLQAAAVESAKAKIAFDQMAESVRTPGEALKIQIRQIDEWGRAFVAASDKPQEAAKAVEALKARVTSLSSANQQSIAAAQAGIQAASAVQAARLSSELQGLQQQRALGYISELDYLQKVGAANVRAAEAEEARIQQAIELAKRLPAEQQRTTLPALNGQAEAAAINTATARAAAEGKVTEAIRTRATAAAALTRAEGEQRALEMAQYEASVGDAYKASALAAADYAQSLQDARQSMVDEAAAGQLSDLQRDIRLRQLAIELKLRQDIRAINAAPYSQDQKDILVAQATANATAAASLAVDQVVQEFQSRGAREVSDALLTALEGGFDSAWDYLKKLAKREVIRIAFQPVTNAIGGVVQGLLTESQGGTSTNGAYLQTASTLSSLYGYGKAAYTWATGGTAGGAAAAQVGAQVGAQAGAQAGSAAASSASSVAATTWAAVVIAALKRGSAEYDAGWTYEVGRDSKNAILGEDAIGQSFSRFSVDSVLTKLGTASGLSDKWASILSGATAIAQLIGRQGPRVTEQGVTGTLGGGDFTGQAYRDLLEKGGWFRSDKRYTETAGVSGALEAMLDAGAADVLKKASEYGAALGLPVTALATVTKDMKVALTDDAEKNKTEIVNALAGYGDALVKGYADAVAPLAAYGETTVQTIERVGGTIKGVNEVLASLGVAALKASVEGGRAALQFEAQFGGIQGLAQVASGYLDNFFSDTERADLTRNAIGKTLGDVGLQVPATRAAFRGLVTDLVNGGALMNETGSRQVATLLSVADAFAAITDAGRSATDILNERLGLERELLTLQGNTTELRARERAALDVSNRSLFDQIKALEDQKTAAEAAKEAADKMASAWQALTGGLRAGVSTAYGDVKSQVQSAQDRIRADADAQVQVLEQRAAAVKSAFKALSESLRSAVDQISGQLAGDGGRGAAMATLQRALVDLRAGRPVDQQAVQQAAGQVARLDPGGFATALDYQRALASTANLLRDVDRAARRQATTEEGRIARLQVAVERARDAQLKALDDQLAEARSAASTLVSIDDGVQNVADAIARLASAIGAAQALNGTGSAVGQFLRNGNTEVYRAVGGAVATRAVGATNAETLIRGVSGSVFTATAAQDFARDRIAVGDFAGLRDRAVAEGIDSRSLDLLLGLPPGTSAEKARELDLPGFAKGTNFVPHDMLARVHQGERIVPAADNAALLRAVNSGGTVVLLQELRALRDEVATLRQQSLVASTAHLVEQRRAADSLETMEVVGVQTIAAT